MVQIAKISHGKLSVQTTRQLCEQVVGECNDDDVVDVEEEVADDITLAQDEE